MSIKANLEFTIDRKRIVFFLLCVTALRFGTFTSKLVGTQLAADSEIQESDKIKFLKSIMPSKEQIDDFVGKTPASGGYFPNAGWTFSPELGWVLRDSIRPDGIDKSKTFYHYEESGARKRVNFLETTSRVHTYGDSFTHCDQVNDGETWQELLAAHLGEPIENFGVGGYSVYQAYLRMRKVEKNHPAKYIILNVYDDDHFRNLDTWRRIRGGTREETLPYVRVNVRKDEIIELPNPCPAPQDLYQLTDLNWVLKRFGSDIILRYFVETKSGKINNQSVLAAAEGFGLPASLLGQEANPAKRLHELHTQAAVFSTIKIVEMAERYARESGKELLVLLSYSRKSVRSYLKGESLFDQRLLDYLRQHNYPFLDLREAHLVEFKTFKLDEDSYLDRYYIGHYGPAGNFFFAMALRSRVVEWLKPSPPTYRLETNRVGR
jgi:hypothetical protein